MTIETALYPTQLNAALPPQSDIVREGAGHLRLLKTVVKTTFPNLGGAWNATQTEANYIVGVTGPIQAQINGKGAITGQAWSGTHSFSGTVSLPSDTSIGSVTRTEISYLSGLTGNIQTLLNAKGSVTGQNWSGTHNFFSATSITVPTLSPGSTGSAAASVDYVNSAAFASALPNQIGNAGKWVTTNGTTASWAALPVTVGVGLTVDFNTLTEVGIYSFAVGSTNGPSGAAPGYCYVARNALTMSQLVIADSTNDVYVRTATGIGFTPSFTAWRKVVFEVSGAIGYGVGAGGTASQPGQNGGSQVKSNPVTLNKPSGEITMGNASLAAGASVEFILNNAFLSPNDGLVVNPQGFTGYAVEVAYFLAATSVVLRVTNKGATRSDAVTILFRLIKGATS